MIASVYSHRTSPVLPIFLTLVWRQSGYYTGILDIHAAEAASVYTYGPRPGQQQASVFTTPRGGVRNTYRDWQYTGTQVLYVNRGPPPF